MKKHRRTTLGDLTTTGAHLAEDDLARVVGGLLGKGGGGGTVMTATLSIDGTCDVASDPISKQA